MFSNLSDYNRYPLHISITIYLFVSAIALYIRPKFIFGECNTTEDGVDFCKGDIRNIVLYFVSTAIVIYVSVSSYLSCQIKKEVFSNLSKNQKTLVKKLTTNYSMYCG